MATAAEYELPDNNQCKGRQINKQTKQDESQPSSSTKSNLHSNNKNKQEIDSFIAGPGMEANRMARTETTLKMHDEFSDVYNGIGHFSLTG